MTDLGGLLDVMHSYGLVPIKPLTPGKVVRMPGNGKSKGNMAGWCRLFPDGIGAVFGDWSSGLVETWQAKRDKPYTPDERAAFARQVAASKKKANIQKAADYAAAATSAAQRWQCAAPAIEHTYLRRKRVLPCGIRQDGNLLIIPLHDINGKIWSIQTINPAGTKLFMAGGRTRGGFYLIGGPITDRIFIAEGFATAASLHIYGDAIGARCAPVVVAFNAGNLKPVVLAIRDKYPDIQITIAADNDTTTPGNPGLTKGREAAALVNAKTIWPNFAGLGGSGTDFNDYVIGGGEL